MKHAPMIFGCCALPLSAMGTVELDQSNPYPGGFVGSSSNGVQQGITTQRQGRLHAVRLWLNASGFPGEIAEGRVSIWFGEPWQSGAPALTVDIEHPTDGGTVPVLVDLWEADVSVSHGERLTLGLERTSLGPTIQFGVTTTDSYPEHRLWGGGQPWSSSTTDMAFELYIDTPAPGTIGAFGLAGAFCLRRRR